MKFNWRRIALGCGAALIGMLAVHTAMAKNGVGGADRDADFDKLLTEEAQHLLDNTQLLDGQSPGTRVTVEADIDTGVINVNFDAGFIPEHYGAAFEDQHDAFRTGLSFLGRKIMDVTAVRYLYGGMPVEAYFDEAWRGVALPGSSKTTASPSSNSAFVAASHGYYYHHGYKDWRFQREPGVGVQEDLITPPYADELQTLLQQRSATPSERARSQLKEINHPESGQAWWKVAARYRIALAYPEERAIWHSQEGRPVYGLRDYNEDINSRPLLANYLGNNVAFHLHTNGNARPQVRGAEIVVQPGRAESLQLGESVLCYMGELVQSAEGYEGFPFAGKPSFADKAENRLARMPSVIVEMAYHSNPDDAAALRDPVFRTASMKGVEKGYRLWREGKGCTPLALKRVTDVTLPPHTVGKADVHFDGHPRFPVTMEITSLECPQGSTCDGGEEIKKKPMDSPLTFEIECGRGDHTRISLWQTVLRDDDGVRSAPAQHRLTCTAPAGSGGRMHQGARAGKIGMRQG